MTQPAAQPLSVEDRFAIQDLYANYAWALDTGEVEKFVACFTPDAVVTEEVFEDPDRWEGTANLRRMIEHYKGAPGFPGRQHHISQLQLEGDGRMCGGRAFAFVTECRGEPPYLLRFAGYYQDRLVKRDATWLFAERIIRLWDGAVLSRFPGHGTWRPRVRPPELKIRN